MMRSIGRHAAALLALVLVVEISAALAQSTIGTSQPRDSEALERAKVMVEDVKVIVQHNGDRAPSHTVHTFRNFSPTRAQVEGDSLVIEGSVTELPSQHAADITLMLRTSSRQGDVEEASDDKPERYGHHRWKNFPLTPGDGE
jgi:hypothetical protein